MRLRLFVLFFEVDNFIEFFFCFSIIAAGLSVASVRTLSDSLIILGLTIRLC